MVNQAALDEIERLQAQYEHNWGRPPDFSQLPRAITQEKLCLIMRRIVNTGESVLSGFSWMSELSMKYYDSIDWSVRYEDGDSLKDACPFCGKPVRISFFGNYQQSYAITCQTHNCLNIISRGF